MSVTGPHERTVEDRETIDQLVLELMPLVKRVANEFRKRIPPHVELDDLISAGIVGLIEAIRKFDSHKGVKIAQYAKFRIRGAILDDIRTMDPVSRDLRRMNSDAQRTYWKLEAMIGRAPDSYEMACALGMTLELWQRRIFEMLPAGIHWLHPTASASTTNPAFVSLDALQADNDGHQFLSCHQRERIAFLKRALQRLPVREQLIIELYYYKELTMREIGNYLGMDESRVSQLHAQALNRLRRITMKYR